MLAMQPHLLITADRKLLIDLEILVPAGSIGKCDLMEEVDICGRELAEFCI